jgi:hypothetical protein
MGCSNQEFAYNEKTTELFLDEMKLIDDYQETFSDSNLVFRPDAVEVISLDTKAYNLQHNSQQAIENMNDLNPSEEAKSFHEAVLAYFNKIKAYGATAKKLLAADSVAKRPLYFRLKTEYEAINQMPDQVLSIQKRYLDRVGIKAK